jgi:hypothetical protein
MAVLVALGLAPEAAQGQGVGGDPKDRLNWPGSPTDRYLTAGEIRDRLHEATEDFFGCFRASLRSRPEGGASVTFTVDGEGAAQAVEVDPGKAPESLVPCVQAVVVGIDFGGHDGDDVEVSYPLLYEVDTRGARVLPYPVVFTKPRPIRLPLLSLPLDVSAGEIRMLELILTQDAPKDVGPAEPETPGEDEVDPGPESSAGDARPAER